MLKKHMEHDPMANRSVKRNYPKNHGISKLVVWRSQNPAIQNQNPSFLEGPMILRVDSIHSSFQSGIWVQTAQLSFPVFSFFGTFPKASEPCDPPGACYAKVSALHPCFDVGDVRFQRSKVPVLIMVYKPLLLG